MFNICKLYSNLMLPITKIIGICRRFIAYLHIKELRYYTLLCCYKINKTAMQPPKCQGKGVARCMDLNVSL